MSHSTSERPKTYENSQEKSPFTLQVDAEGIATLIFDYPGEKVNKFSIFALKELDRVVQEAEQNTKIKALILKSGKKDIFIAGADLNAFKEAEHNVELVGDMIRTGHEVFDKIAALPFPTIALIDGTCLGGGLECALACTYRIATDNPKTQIGLPEVTLGIMPGWGGTQRLPRLAGLQTALKMILGGKPVDGKKAFYTGVVDLFVPSSFAEERALAFAQSVMTSQGKAKVNKQRKRGGFLNFLLEGNPVGRSVVFSQARKGVLEKTKGHYPAPLVAIDTIQKTYSLPIKKGLVIERDTFIEAIGSEFRNAKHLVNLFFTSEALKKQPEATAAEAKKVSTAGVLGAGTMGGGIAWLFSYRGIDIRMKDINWNAVGLGYGAARKIYDQLVKKRRLKPFEAHIKFHKIGGTIDYASLKGADFVVEAAVENLDIKRQIFKELEEVVSKETIIASNTSSLTIKDMSRDMAHPERFVGMHFFNPVNRMPLVEVVAGPKSSPEAIATTFKLCQRLKKTPIVVGDCPGFLVNRVFMAGADEILRMVDDGVPLKKVERAMVDFGMPMSPFLLVDEIGVDVTYKVAQSMYAAYGERMAVPKILERVAEAKLLGKKSGKGFFIHKGKESVPNPDIHKFIGDKCLDLHEDEIVLRSILMMVNEACRCLEEGIIKDPAFLDMAMIMGTGFPPFRGGLLRYANEQGISWVKERMDRFAEEYGERFKPCKLVEEYDYEGRNFYT